MQHRQDARCLDIALPVVFLAQMFPQVGGDVLEKERFVDEQRDLLVIERRDDGDVLGQGEIRSGDRVAGLLERLGIVQTQRVAEQFNEHGDGNGLNEEMATFADGQHA